MPTTYKTTPRRRHVAELRVKKSRIANPFRNDTLARSRNTTLLASAAVLSVGAAGAAVVVLRRQIRKLALDAAAEAISAGRSVGKLRDRMAKRSLLARILPATGALAAFVVVAGSALILMAPKLRSAKSAEAPMPDNLGPRAHAHPDVNSSATAEGKVPASHAAT